MAGEEALSPVNLFRQQAPGEQVRPGQGGAGGGVGTAAIQLAKTKNIKIIGTSSSWKHDKLMNPAVGRVAAYHYSSSVEIKESIAVFGISKNGIDYDSPDSQKVHFILLR